MDGIVPVATSLDSVGDMARLLQDLALVSRLSQSLLIVHLVNIQISYPENGTTSALDFWMSISRD